MDVKGKVIYATVALIFVLLVASTASALSITGNSNLSLCQCESAKIDLNVCATFAGTYNIVKSGTAAPWVLIAPTSLTLAADECQHLYAFVTPNCYAQASPYTVDFNFNGPEFGKATLGILVRQCHTSNFTITPLSSSSKPCQENTYDMSIKNTSNFADEYILSQTGLPDSWVSYNKDKFVVDAGQSYSTQLKVKSACSADAKTYAFAMKLSNTKTNNSSEVPLSQQIVGFVPFTSNISPSISSCSETDTNIYVRVTNHSDTNDVIALETDANYVTINTPSVNVSAGASVDVVLTVKKMQASHKDFNFKIYSNNFEKSYVTPISLTVNNCYGVSIQRITSDTNYCTGVVEQKFVIRNSGLADINGFLKLSGMNADLNTVSLVSGEEKEVVLKLNPDHAGHYDMNLDLISDNTNFTLPFSVNFETCTDANLLVPQVTLCAGAQPQRFLTIFNTGTKTQTFNLTTNAPGVTFESNTVTLEPASSQEVPIAFDPLASATGSYNITASSGSFSVSRALNVRVASNEECYSFETVASTPLFGPLGTNRLDVNCENGNIVDLNITNTSLFDQNISLVKIAPSWVTLSEDFVYLTKGETKTAYLYFAPRLCVIPAERILGPVDAKINVFNDKNISKTVLINLNVIGDCNFSKSTANVTESNIKVDFDFVITNDTNAPFDVLDVNVEDINYTVYFNKLVTLDVNQTSVTKISFEASPSEAGTDKNVLVIVKTSNGNFERMVTVHIPGKNDLAGLFGAFFEPAVIGVILLIILAIIIMLVIKLGKKHATKVDDEKNAAELARQDDLAKQAAQSKKKVKAKKK